MSSSCGSASGASVTIATSPSCAASRSPVHSTSAGRISDTRVGSGRVAEERPFEVHAEDGRAGPVAGRRQPARDPESIEPAGVFRERPGGRRRAEGGDAARREPDGELADRVRRVRPRDRRRRARCTAGRRSPARAPSRRDRSRRVARRRRPRRRSGHRRSRPSPAPVAGPRGRPSPAGTTHRPGGPASRTYHGCITGATGRARVAVGASP